MGTECTTIVPQITACKKRKIDVNFDGGNVTSDGGILLLRAADKALGLVKKVASVISDHRRLGSRVHSIENMIRQRVFAICLGYEDLNDHDTLRKDPAIQTAIDCIEDLASPSTLCRMENNIDPSCLMPMSEVIVDTFLDSYPKPLETIVLDFDSTDDLVHGQQDGRYFNAYYDHYCFHPLYVFCGHHLLASYLRPGYVHSGHNARAVLKLLVEKIRSKWPKVKIVFRGDSGFQNSQLLTWCDNNGVDYVIGVAKNSRLLEMASYLMDKAEVKFDDTGKKAKYFSSVEYAAGSWDQQRRVVIKAEHDDQGANPRFVVTSLGGGAKHLYEKIYCARGDMENRIKEKQLCLFADRTSCSEWYANQFRLLLSSLAYVLMEYIRRVGLKGTKMATAQCSTIRVKLFKIGAVITRNTRRIRFFMSSAFPYQQLFFQTLARLCPG